MNFSSMKYFTVLAREKSFTKAAEQLHITQQSLSSHIAGLEKEFGCKLIVRHVPLELTYAGEVFLRYASDFSTREAELLREFTDISQNQTGVLRIGCGTSRGLAILPKAIAEFQVDYPNIRIEMAEAANDVLCDMLRKGSLDIAIADFKDNEEGISMIDLYTEKTLLLIPRVLFEQVFGEASSQIIQELQAGDLRSLRSFPFVTGSFEDINGRIGLTLLKQAGIDRPVIKAFSHNVGMLLKLCVQCVGACFCPDYLMESVLNEEEFANIMVFQLRDEIQYNIKAGFNPKSYQWSAIKAFISTIQAEQK